MPDLLTHVLAAYVLATVASWRVGWIRRRHVPLAMVGSVIPDAAKVFLLVGSSRPTVAGVEVSLLALQTVGVALCFAAAATILVPPAERMATGAVLGGGVGLHVLLDYGVVRVGGYAPPYLYPMTWAQLPSPDLYLSSDVWPSVIAVLAATLVYVYARFENTAGT